MIMTPRHHLVPQMYLRNFANADSQVALADRDDPTRRFVTSVRKACAEVGFYRIEPEAIDASSAENVTVHPELVEQELSKFETAASPGLSELVRTRSKDSLTMEDWYHLVNFIALQSVRGRRWREDFDSVATHAARQYLAESLSDKEIRDVLKRDGKRYGKAAVREYRSQMLGEEGPRLQAPQTVHVFEGVKMAFDVIAPRLAERMSWEVIEAPSVAVLTGDEPVCWWAPGDSPVGYFNAKVIWMPLSRDLVLQLTDSETDLAALGLPDLETPAGRDELVALVNREIAGQAERWIVHHPDTDPLEGLDIPKRTRWVNQLVDVRSDDTTVTESYIHRRLPVQD